MSDSVQVLENRDALSASRYRVIARLGRGGMAEVFLAIQSGITGFRRLSVVKRLRSDFSEDDFLGMFEAEARLAVRLNHPNVVHTYEVGHDGDCHFISMEFLRGQSYQRLLKRVGRDQLDFAYSVRVLIEALKGLSYAHHLADYDGTPLNIVHRDTSPSNIFITYDGQIKILDFGIAKALGKSADTQSGVLKGKLAYMAPEQAAGNSVGAQADLYAVGVLLWEAAARRRRWEGIQDAEIMKHLIANEPPVSPGALEAGLPLDVDALCLQALAPDPADRFESADEFRAELEALLQKMGRQVSAEDVGKLLAQNFEEESERLQRVIETKMKEYESGDDLTVASLTQLKEGATRSSRPPRDQSGVETIRAPFFDEREQRRRRWLLAGAVVGGVLLLGAGYAAVNDGARGDTSSGGVPANVSVRVGVQPATAKLLWDGRVLDGNPYTAQVPRSQKTIRLRAEAEGYVAQSAILSLDADRDVRFTLEALPAAPAPPVASAPEPESEPEKSPARPASPPKPRVRLDTSDPWRD